MAGFTWTEKPLKEFLKTMIIGGISFLLPIALAVFILSYAFRLVKRIATPISHGLHLDQWGDVAGVSAATSCRFWPWSFSLRRRRCRPHHVRRARRPLV